jgi:hypothetical protein
MWGQSYCDKIGIELDIELSNVWAHYDDECLGSTIRWLVILMACA